MEENNYLSMARSVQREISESKEQIDVVPGVVQQPGVQSRFVSLLLDYRREQKSIRRHFEADRVLVVLLREESAALACSKAQAAVPVHRYERAQFQECRSIEISLSGAFIVILVSDILGRFVGHY